MTNLEEVQNTTDKKGKGKKTVDATIDSCKCLIFCVINGVRFVLST